MQIGMLCLIRDIRNGNWLQCHVISITSLTIFSIMFKKSKPLDNLVCP